MLFAIVAFSVFLLMHVFVYLFFFKRAVRRNGILICLRIFLIVNYCGILGYFFGRYYSDIPQVLYFLLSLPVGVIFILFVSMLVYNILSLLPKFSTKRRAFFEDCVNYGSGIFTLSYLGYGIFEGALKPEVKEVDISLGLAKNLKAIQISDLHIGGLIEESVVGGLVDRVNSFGVDIIFLTGDIIDANTSKVKKALDELGSLKATLGVYFVVGNHEYFHDISNLLPILRSFGIKILENENVIISKDGIELLNVCGVYDLFGRRIKTLEPNLNEALKNRNKNLPSLLLAHQPKFALEVDESHNVDLILSGHTHGGQIFPFRFLVTLDQPYLQGLYNHNKKTKIYVNKGTGFWGPPIRILARAEITYFNFS
ncbi:metallophosphoesterase [Helicobacter sp. WB40]|uniref:metallophosphoesterase n=1 Tax=Helicobacter sp. WB40 TaxID=3004130 RepID=UPI0022EC13AD|nr:metallophosphoesterase [Helicobacter sp. WB40]MDA3967340.1 metallophosphoesterase [Helicobacter sp. WB40]